MKKVKHATAAGEDYLEAVLVLQQEKRDGKIRGCSPAHGGVKAQCVPCSGDLERGRLPHHG